MNMDFLDDMKELNKYKPKVKVRNLSRPIESYASYSTIDKNEFLHYYNTEIEYNQFFEECEEQYKQYEVDDNPVVILNYREKNYYNLKKSNK